MLFFSTHRKHVSPAGDWDIGSVSMGVEDLEFMREAGGQRAGVETRDNSSME